MERPKVHEVTPVQREVTPEIIYLDMMRRAQRWPEPYEKVSDIARQAYERDAEVYRKYGVRPAIMDEYERYDSPTSPLEASCVALADELLSHKDEEMLLTFVDIVATMPPDEVAERLKQIDVKMLANDDEQLALESDGSYYPILDVRKCDATLTGVRVNIWGWDDEKHIKVGRKKDRGMLVYPSDEKFRRRKIELMLDYDHPVSQFYESVHVTVGDVTEPYMGRSIWMPAYAATGYEGHHHTAITASKRRVAQFADLVAEMVGDVPESTEEYHERLYAEYEQQVVSPTAQEYLREWVENTFVEQVLYDLQRLPVDTDTSHGDTTLYKALLAPEYAHQACNVLIGHVNGLRSDRNTQAKMNRQLDEGFGALEPWHDLVARPKLQVRRARHQWPPLH